MAFLSKDQIMTVVVELPCQAVPVPEWGGDVMVQGLSGTERDAYEASVWEQRGKTRVINLKNMRARLLQKCIVDPETKGRVFGEADIAALGRRSAKVLDRLFDVARELSGLSDDDVEELAGKSESDQSEDSGSD